MSAKCPLGKFPQDILASFPGSLLKKKGGESLHGTKAKHIQLDSDSGLIPMQDPVWLV